MRNGLRIQYDRALYYIAEVAKLFVPFNLKSIKFGYHSVLKKLTVFINDEPVFEYDRENVIEDKYLEFLDKMDKDMNTGIKISGELFAQPDSDHRTKFVAMNLIKALQQDNQAVIAASCAYLSHRRPALVEVRVNDQDGGLVFDLVDEKIQ